MAATNTDIPIGTNQLGLADQLGAEYRALTESCGLIDRSERGKLALSGPEAKVFLAGQVTNDIEALDAGSGCYAAFLTHKGKMLGDLRVLDVGNELLLDTERVTLQGLFDMIRRFRVGYELELHKRTVERGLLSLIGPDAARLAHAEVLPGVEHANAAVEIDGIATIAVRTDTGVDLICAVVDTDALTETLRERGAIPVSGEAAEIVRVEHGRPRYGVDIDDSTIPQEAGLNERAVSFTKGCYVGQETVARLYYRGKPNRHLRGLRLSSRGPAPPPAAGAQLRLGERAVGRLGSAVLSPIYGPIGLGLVRREAGPGTRVSVGEHGASAEIVELPFTRAAHADSTQAPEPPVQHTDDGRGPTTTATATPANGHGPTAANDPIPTSTATERGAPGRMAVPASVPDTRG